MNWLMSKLIGAYVGRVQNSVKSAGGHLTWNFSQCVDPVATLIGTDTVTRDGICEMLSAKWIDEHAHDSALPNWLMDRNQINASKIRLLMQWFIIGDTMRPSKMIDPDSMAPGIQRGEQNQDKATQNFLLSRGIIRRGGGLQNGWGVGNKAGGAKIKIKLAADLIDSRGGTGSYRIIGIYGSGGSGHCMACYTGLKDIAFFDPNFGEFWFEDKRKFVKWFTDDFFPKSFYSNILNDHYELFDYAMRAGLAPRRG